MGEARPIEPAEPIAQPEQGGQLVAQSRGFLELRPLSGGCHLDFQTIHDRQVAAVEKLSGLANVSGVSGARGERGTRAEAGAQVVAQATGRVQHGK